MNFVPCEVAYEAGTPRLVTAERLTLPGRPPADMAEGRRLVFGVRPEHVVPSEAGEGFPLRVAVVEPTGSETLLVGKLGERNFQVSLKERRRVVPHDELRFRPLPGTVHLFDAESGNRVQ